MNDANVEDISLDGTNVPIFAYHRKFESVETTIAWPTDDELEAYVTSSLNDVGNISPWQNLCSTRRSWMGLEL